MRYHSTCKELTPIKRAFDEEIKRFWLTGLAADKEAILKPKETDFQKGVYCHYLNLTYVEENIETLNPSLLDNLKHGYGAEITGKPNQKFNSCASSSLLAYLYSNGVLRKSNPDYLTLEYQPAHPQKKGAERPNLDIYTQKGLQCHYYEAKCHEIMDDHQCLLFSPKYDGTLFHAGDIAAFDAPSRASNSCERDKENEGKNFATAEDIGIHGLQSYRFDLKQFICHLFGIATDRAIDTSSEFVFTYLFFVPGSMAYVRSNDHLKKIYQELLSEIHIILKNGDIQSYLKGIVLEINFVGTTSFQETTLLRYEKGAIIDENLL
jgi:hypothetical protein